MDFDFSDEQTILKDALNRLLSEGSGDVWKRLVEMGFMAMLFSEKSGGLGGGPVETMIVMEALGGARAPAPYFSTVVLGGGFVRFGGSAEQKAELIQPIADGSLKLALAYIERHSRYDLARVQTSARPDGDGFVISGTKNIVIGGDSADRIFVTARTSDGDIGIFLVDANAPGVYRSGYPTQDGLTAADIRFDNARVAESALFKGGLPLVRRVIDAATAALCAEAVGVMSAMQVLTLDYLKTREQFGVPIGSFQALQHKAVDMYVALEQARSITLYATMMCEADDDLERSKAMHAAKAEIGRCGKLVGETAIQLHGGVGLTAELTVGHYFKRMTMIDLMLGDSDHHLQALAKLGGLFERAPEPA